jgi:hypothetical protein
VFEVKEGINFLREKKSVTNIPYLGNTQSQATGETDQLKVDPFLQHRFDLHLETLLSSLF